MLLVVFICKRVTAGSFILEELLLVVLFVEELLLVVLFVEELRPVVLNWRRVAAGSFNLEKSRGTGSFKLEKRCCW